MKACLRPYPYPQYHLAQLSKSPCLGRVKTRLLPALSKTECVDLHKALTQAVFKTLTVADLCPLTLWAGEGPSGEFFNDLINSHDASLRFQPEGNLGERLSYIVKDTLMSAEAIIVVGSDCPFIDKHYLSQAIAVLQQGYQAVIGPALDGGYVLLGVTRWHEDLFSGIQWGTGRVLEQTCERLDELNWSYQRLNPLADIDRPQDLSLLASQPQDSALQGFAHRYAVASKLSQ